MNTIPSPHIRRHGFCIFLILFCLSYCWMYCASPVLSNTWNQSTLNHDINIYHVIGRSWMEGVVPYRDLVDVKGPLHFLVYGLASLMAPFNLQGMLFFASATLALSMLFVFKIARLYLPFSLSIAATIICLLGTGVFAGHPAEFILTLQLWTLYLFLRSVRERPSLKTTFIYGLCAGLTLAIKFNLVAFFAPFIIYQFIKDKNTASLFIKHVLLLVTGVLVVWVPICSYFYGVDALRSLWDGYFLTGFSYAREAKGAPILMHPNLTFFGQFVPGYPLISQYIHPAIVAGVAMGLLFGGLCNMTLQPGRYRLKRRDCAFLWGALVLSLFAVMGTPYYFFHYFFPFYPFVFLTMIVMIHRVQKYMLFPHHASVWILGSMVLFAIASGLVHHLNQGYLAQRKVQQEALERMTSIIHPKDRPAPTILTVSPDLTSLYRFSPHSPPCKNFVPQLTSAGRQAWEQECIGVIVRQKVNIVFSLVGSDGVPQQVPEKIRAALFNHYRLKQVYPCPFPASFAKVGVFLRKQPQE